MDIGDLFSLTGDDDTIQICPIDYSMNKSQTNRSSPDATHNAEPLGDKKPANAETKEERLKISLRESAAKVLSIGDSANLKMSGTIAFKDEKSCKSFTINFSDILISPTTEHQVNRRSKRKNPQPVRFGASPKLFKPDFTEYEGFSSDNDVIVPCFTAPDCSKSPLQADLIMHEASQPTKKADFRLTELNEPVSLLASSLLTQVSGSYPDQTNGGSQDFSISVAHHLPRLQGLNCDKNKSMVPGGSTAESLISHLNSSFQFSLPSLPSSQSSTMAQNCRAMDNVLALLSSDVESGTEALGAYQIPTLAPMLEILRNSVSCNALVSYSPLSPNSISQSPILSSNNNWKEISMPDFANSLMPQTFGQENRSSSNAPSHLQKNPIESEPELLNADHTIRRQPGRTRRKRGRRPTRYVCNLCNRPFQKVCDLNLHTSAVHGCYRCHLCNAKFTQRSNLQRHEPIHSGARPYKCLRCPKDYLRADHLKRHMNREHPGYDPNCDTLVLSSSSQAYPRCSDGHARFEGSNMDMNAFSPNQSPFAERPSPKSASHGLWAQESSGVTESL